MNLAFLLDRAHGGNGTARMAVGVARALLRLGHEVHFYCAVPAPGAAPRLAFGEGEVRMHWIPSLRGAMRVWSLPIGAGLLGLRGRHDVVVSNNLVLWQDVAVMHNDPQEVEFGKLARAQFRVGAPVLGGWKHRVRRFLETRRFRPGGFQQVIALSRRSAGEARAAFAIPGERVAVVPHGVDGDHFSPAHAAAGRDDARRRWGIGSGRAVFLYIGDAWKGLEFALRGLALLPWGERPVLFAVGPFPPEPFGALAASLGVPFRYSRPQEDVRPFYALADAFLLPTPLDTFGLCVLEAMAMGVPTVVSRLAGVAELLTHGRDAWILDDPADAAEIARAAAALLDPARRLRMAEAGLDTAAARTWSRTAAGHLVIYRKAAGLPELLMSRGRDGFSGGVGPGPDEEFRRRSSPRQPRAS